MFKSTCNTVWMELVYPDAKLPQRANNGAIGYDVFAYEVLDPTSKERIADLPFTLQPGQRAVFGIGVKFAMPWPKECQVRPRSGLSSRHGIDLGNSPGTVDPDFRGYIGILLYNRGQEPYTIIKRARIAQLVFANVRMPAFEVVKTLPPTKRGIGGFGSTGQMAILEGTTEFDLQRLKLDRYYMNIALATAKRSNCARGCPRDNQGQYLRNVAGDLVGQTRSFGCIIVKGNAIIANGYNAQAPGLPLCGEVGCLREANHIPTGTQIERCRAVHAKQMAFVCASAPVIEATKYATAEPCEVCAKMIAGSNMEALVVLTDVYPTNGVQIVRDSGVNVRLIRRDQLL